MTFWTRANHFPPVLVRLLAKRPHGPALTDQEISRASGLPLMRVHMLSQSTDWSGVDLITMRQFLIGCGVDFCNSTQMERVHKYLVKRPTWKYLRVSPHWRPLYEPLMRIYKRSVLNP